MGDVIQIEWGQLDMLFEDMEAVKGHITTLDTYFADHVCSTKGFEFALGALEPFCTALESMRGHFTSVKETFEKRYDGLVHATAVSAEAWDKQDGVLEYDFNRILGGPRPVPKNPAGRGGGVEVRGIPIVDPADHLEDPPAGEQQFPKDHDVPFQEVSKGWDEARDQINSLIKWVRDQGITFIPELPDKSIEEYIVFPLTGNYYAIQQNASACKSFARAMRKWSKNFPALAGKSLLAMEGKSGLALNAHISLYSVVISSVSLVFDGLSKVFDQIAKMSERLATKVEKIIRVLGQKLLKLGKFFMKRATGWIGIALFVKDIATEGTEYFKDLWNDVTTVKDLIDTAFGLADKVTKWAKEQADRIDTVKQVITIMEKLPNARFTMDLSDLGRINTKNIEKTVKDMKADFGDPKGTAFDDLEAAVDEGVKEAGVSPEETSDCAPPPAVNPITGQPIDTTFHPPMVPPKPATAGVR